MIKTLINNFDKLFLEFYSIVIKINISLTSLFFSVAILKHVLNYKLAVAVAFYRAAHYV